MKSVFLVLICIALCLSVTPRLHAEPLVGRVVGIVDGDTLSVFRCGTVTKVRLWGIDAPEKTQPFGMRARQRAGELAFQRDVTIVVHATDRYGRLVGEVFLPEGDNLGYMLVTEGLAWWYQQYAPHHAQLASLEAEARATKRGLWADAAPVAPWVWRQRKR